MIREIKFQNFRGQVSKSYSVGAVNRVIGKNGAGKSTVKEALAFCFTGKDSTGGNYVPTHLISDGTGSMSVTVTTDRSVLTRTLTSKKASKITLERSGVPGAQIIAQKDLEALLLDSERFLAATVPGWFWTQAPAKRDALLAKIIPPVDKYALLGVNDLWIKDLLSKKSELNAAQDVAVKRREMQRSYDTYKGELNALPSVDATTSTDGNPDIKYAGIVEAYQAAVRIDNDRLRYERELAVYKNALAAGADATKRIAEIERELASIPTIDIPDRTTYDTEIAELQASLRLVPPRPVFQVSLDDRPTCSACGQTIGLKHREKVQKANDAALTEWQAVHDEVTAFNSNVSSRIQELRSKQIAEEASHREAHAAAAKYSSMRMALDRELYTLRRNHQQPLAAPSKPKDVVSDFAKLSTDYEAYRKEKAQYDHMIASASKSASRREHLNAVLADLAIKIDILDNIEQRLKALPQQILEAQVQYLSFDGLYTLSVDSGEVTLFRHNVPYALLSTGERLVADTALCAHFNRLLRKPGFIFVDNADLVDDVRKLTEAAGGQQLFLAYIDADVEDVTVTSL